jgi:hypothetical protein
VLGLNVYAVKKKTEMICMLCNVLVKAPNRFQKKTIDLLTKREWINQKRHPPQQQQQERSNKKRRNQM